MNIPAYWSKATAEKADLKGHPVSFSCWRSSNHSHEDAYESALEAAQRALRALTAGRQLDRYTYDSVPLREETVEKFTNSQGDVVAAVTRNAYGCLVLNADQMMFIDIDFPSVSFGESVRHLFARLFNKLAVPPVVRRESEARERLEEFLGNNHRWGVRLYRTFAGLRAVVTHDLFDPGAEAVLTVLRQVGADPLYVRLCKGQQCFRARLTPKPWRCGHTANCIAWPWENEDQQAQFRQWQSEYDKKHRSYATCRFLGSFGSEHVHSELAALIEVHDHLTRCTEPLELA